MDSWWRHVARVADVDGLVDVDVGLDLAEVVAETFGLPVVPLRDIDRAGPTKWTTHPASLPKHGDPTQAPVIACADGPLWQAVAAGDFSPEHEREHQDTVRFRRPRGADEVARNALRGQTFLERGVEGFYERASTDGPWPIPAVVWVTAKDSVLDSLWFWNFRAIQSRNFEPSPMILVPINDVHNWLNFSRDLGNYLTRSDEFAPDVSLMSLTVPKERLHSFATDLLDLVYTKEFRTSNKWPVTQRTPPFTYGLNHDLRELLTFGREYGEEVEVEAHPVGGKMTLRLSSPVTFSKAGHTMLRMRSTLFDGLPRKDVIADKIITNASWRGNSIQIATNARNDYRLNVKLPALDDAVRALIECRTTRFNLSEKGRLADALSADTDLAILLRPGVYEAATHLTTPRSSAFRREMQALRTKGMPEDEVQAFGARWGGRGARRYDSASGFVAHNGKWATDDPVGAFETLCEIGWAERGAETNCSRCGLQSFVPISTLDRGAHCPGCRAATSYTVDTAGLAVQYRLNTLIDLASDQGVLPHLLVFAELTRRYQRTKLLGGTLTTFPDDSTAEVDILGVHDQCFVAGEVKTKARDFTQQQLERDIAVSARLDVDLHILAAVDAIPASVVDTARKLATDARLDLLVLSREHLRPPASDQ